MKLDRLAPRHLARVLRVAADELDRIAAEESLSRSDWIGQAESPLGRKRHCAAVRRLVAEGNPGAAIVGRRHLLAPDALSDALGEVSRPKSKAPAETSPEERLAARLRLVGGAL